MCSFSCYSSEVVTTTTTTTSCSDLDVSMALFLFGHKWHSNIHLLFLALLNNTWRSFWTNSLAYKMTNRICDIFSILVRYCWKSSCINALPSLLHFFAWENLKADTMHGRRMTINHSHHSGMNSVNGFGKVLKLREHCTCTF